MWLSLLRPRRNKGGSTVLDALPSTESDTLRELLHLIAESSSPAESASKLLEVARTVSGAFCAAFMLFDDPFMVHVNIPAEYVPPADAIAEAVRVHGPGIHPLPDLKWIDHSAAAAIFRQKQVVGALWLGLESPLEVSDTSFDALLDAFSIVARERLTLAQQERLNRSQNEFLRIVSHDLRSPLTSMHGFASMLEAGMAGTLNDKQMHFVERILAGVTTMTNLVDNIQDAGRYDPETGFYEMQRTACDVEEIVRRIVSNHLLPADRQELTVAVEFSEVPQVSADRTMLERAVTNLVDNAIKYTPNGGTITVGTRRSDDSLIVFVRDTGLGIAPENQRRLFERHVRIPKPEHKRIKGSGLGLFIVRSVAQRHGGRAWVESVEGQGSTFCFSIPLHAPQ
jgi:signal transduction histidine kinase